MSGPNSLRPGTNPSLPFLSSTTSPFRDLCRKQNHHIEKPIAAIIITPPIAASAIPYVGIVVDLVPGSCSFGFSVVDGDGDGVGADEEGVFVVTALELKT